MTTRDLSASPSGSVKGGEEQLTQLFEARVDAQPNSLAVRAGERALTYRELDAAANRLAHALGRLGVRHQDLVAVACHRSIEALVAFLGVLKAGAAYVPVDPEDPPARLQLIGNDTDARVVIAQEPFVAAMQALDRPILTLDAALDALSDEDDHRPSVPSSPTDLAYVMYTSGSTGRPKGVAIEHRNVAGHVQGARNVMPHRGEGMLQVSKLDFDAQTWEIWGAWDGGAWLEIVPPGEPDPALIARLVAERDVDVALLSPGLFRQMVEAQLSSLGSLRLLLVGGDVMSPVHARRFVDAFPALPLVNLYGPTEVTVCCSWYRVEPLADGRSVPIGRALGNTELHVLDEDGRPVANGVPGELFIGGGAVGRGYLNLPQPTARAFVPDPFTEAPGTHLYRTGDRVRVLPDGNLEFIGRRDHQVKIRGYRIEPAEVEAGIRAVPGIVEAVVVPREDLPGHRRLVAYVVTAPGGPDTAHLLRALEQRLPAHMVPSAIVSLRELPLTSRGKIDRAALPAPLDARRAPSDRGTPGNSVERELTAIWGEVLHVDDVGVNEDFLELGGDSLLAVRLTVLVKERLGVELPLDAVFTDRTISELARRIGVDSPGDAIVVPEPTRQRWARRRSTPVTTTQAQALVATELAEGALPYQFQALVHLEGHLDVATLERALGMLVERHEILRTRFVRRGLGWRQIVDAPFEVRVPVIDLRSSGDPAQELAGLAVLSFAEPISVDRLPLVRWRLARLTDDHVVLLHAEHHLIHDGWSWGIFLEELASTYGALVERRPSPLPLPQLQFRDFARWQQNLHKTAIGREQLAYWERALDALPTPLTLPTDRPRPNRQTYRGGQLGVEISRSLTDRLRAAGNEQNATVFMTTLAAFFALLGRYSGQEDLVVGSGVANRRFAATERMIGMILNTVALRLDLAGDPTVAELLARVRETTLGAFAHQDVPFEHVLEAVAPQRRPGIMPVYQVLFSFQDPPSPNLDVPGLVITPDDTTGNGSTKADLNVIVINRRGVTDGLTIVWEYSTDLFDASTAQQLLDSYVNVLEAMTGDPDRRLSELPVLSDDERRAIAEAAGGSASYERDSSIPEIFAARVQERPEAVAVVSDAGELSYAELDRRANRLAHRLISMGAGPDRRVGVLVERSPTAVVALLAVLKSGAAYVALDSSSPRPRISELLRDAGVVAVCVSEPLHGLVPSDVPTVPVDDPTLEGEPTSDPGRSVAATDLAYVGYTSGTTGDPKGVAIPHRAVARLVRGTTYVDLDENETLLLLAPLAFDASTFEIWGALLNGARLAVAPDGPLSPVEISTIIRRFGVTTLWLTAGLFHQFVERCPETVPHLRQLLAGGDVLSPEHCARAVALLPPDGVLVNGYGPTEGTTFTCCHRMPAGSVVEQPVPIGRPIENTRCYVVGQNGELVPPGVIGELWIGGDGVAAGYLGAPRLSAEHFIPDRFGPDPGARLYRSGDRVRRRTDGTIEFVGRVDRQVKIRGFRVEAAAIERALLDDQAVRAAAVVPRLFGPDDRRLVAYVVPRGDEWSVEGTRAFLSDRLAPHEVPSAWVELAELPLNQNGKVDHAALPEPETPATLPAAEAAPSEFEQALIEIWQDVLGVRPISPDDDFFDLGGHSLLAVELFARIETTTGVRLPLASIFDAPTVGALTELVRSNGWSTPAKSRVALTATGTRTPLFFIAAGDGNSVGFGALARRLGPDQPFYSLQPRGLDGRAMLDTSVTAMARRYTDQIRAVQSCGPYVVGGRCFGTLVAHEVTRLLEEAGEEVALEIALDSVGPMWQPRRLANGLPFDEVMNLVRVYDWTSVADESIFTDAASADQFVDWIREPVTADGVHVVNRYLHAAYRARPDLQIAYPLAANQHAGLVYWGRVGGIPEMGMNPDLLPPAPDAESARPSVDPRHRSVTRRAAARAVDALDVLSRGRVRSLARRRQRRLLELASQMVLRYRAGTTRAPIALLRSEEYRWDAQLARWHGIVTGGVDEYFVDGTHESMMREPAVASTAAAVETSVAAALEAHRAPRTGDA